MREGSEVELGLGNGSVGENSWGASLGYLTSDSKTSFKKLAMHTWDPKYAYTQRKRLKEPETLKSITQSSRTHVNL